MRNTPVTKKVLTKKIHEFQGPDRADFSMLLRSGSEGAWACQTQFPVCRLQEVRVVGNHKGLFPLAFNFRNFPWVAYRPYA